MAEQSGLFASVQDAEQRLASTGYLADDELATTVFLADQLGMPLLVEGPAGVGKTELAKAVAQATGAGLVRLQCYEGLDESRALYEWNYRKQLLRLQVAGGDSAETWEAAHDDIFSEDFLLARPLLEAIRRAEPTVLLIDEADKSDVEMEGLLLEILAEFQVTVPELGTIRATRRPFVVLTSNGARELSDALKRRCLFLAIAYPSPERERQILLGRVPELSAELAVQITRTGTTLRSLDLRKPPSVSESIDWARALVALGCEQLDAPTIRSTLGTVLKHTADRERAVEALRL